MPSKNTHIPCPSPRTSIRWKVQRQSVLMVTFCILLLGGLSFGIVTSVFNTDQFDVSVALKDLRIFSITVLILSSLLLVLAVLLSTLLARGLTRSISDLSAKVQTLRPGHWSFKRTITSGDEIEALDCVIDDLTRRLRDVYQHLEEKVAERTRQVQEAYALDRTILESIEHGIVAIDSDGRITQLNPAASRILQLTDTVVVGEKAADVLKVLQRKEPAQGDGHPVTSVLNTRKPYHSHPSLHVRLLLPDQTTLPVGLVIAPLLSGKKLFGALAVIQDQTVERQIDYLKSEFISLASHQLRTPLSSIRWYAEMLLSNTKDMPKEYHAPVAEIDTAAKRMANLIEALLRVAKLEEGGLKPERTRVDLRILLKKIGEEWSDIAREQKVILGVTMPSGPIILQTDATLLEVVLQNILLNAVKYSLTKKPVQLSVEKGPRMISIVIQDHGVGIPRSERARVFQKFFRAKNVRQFDTDGSGLGLYMSKSIVESLGGSIAFESEEGKGSTFTVTLPAA